MIYKTVSSKEIISKVITDLRLQEKDHSISDMVEWIGEALDIIGAFRQYNIKVTGLENIPLLEVSDYQVKLPNDLIRPLFIQYSTTKYGPFQPLKWNSSPLSFRADDNLFNTNSTTVNTYGNYDIVYFTMDLLNIDYETAIDTLNNDPIFKSKISSIMTSDIGVNKTNTSTGSQSIKYTINNNYIKFNVKTGYIRLVYTSIPLDEGGYPLVPNDSSFRNALYWYIVMKLYYPDWVLGQIRDRVFEHAESKWRFFARQAYGNALMPDMAQLESIKNQWLKLVPEIFSFDIDFSQASEQELLYNH